MYPFHCTIAVIQTLGQYYVKAFLWHKTKLNLFSKARRGSITNTGIDNEYKEKMYNLYKASLTDSMFMYMYVLLVLCRFMNN